jgi:hypothetical protein
MSAVAMQSAVRLIRRKSCWLGTPEIYFRKTIDNSRLVKVEDPRREREMKQFGMALCLCCSCWSWDMRCSISAPLNMDTRSRRCGRSAMGWRK